MKKATKAKLKKLFKEGDKYRASMDWDVSLPKENKDAFKKARWEWQKVI